MSEKNLKVFAGQMVAFTSVVDAILKDKKTNLDFRKQPIAVLEKYGIAFNDNRLREKVEKELLSAFAENELASGAEVMCVLPATAPEVVAVILVGVAVKIGGGSEELEFEDIFNIDQERVDYILNPLSANERIKQLEYELQNLKSQGD